MIAGKFQFMNFLHKSHRGNEPCDSEIIGRCLATLALLTHKKGAA
jgi:hypothetical protein